MQKKGPMGPHKLLKVCNGFFFGGLGLTAVIYLIGRFYTWRGNEAPMFLWLIAGAGFLSLFRGLQIASLRLCCPYCGASLMADGRVPTDLPHFCPDCGKNLDNCG